MAAGREVEDIKGARTKDAQDLLANAKQRLEILHSEVGVGISHNLIAAFRIVRL